jgi:UDP-glucose 4-epimerase
MAISSLTQKEPVAITGSTGFIGSNLVRIVEKENIPFIEFKGELLDLKSVKDFFNSNPVKQVIHLAGSFFGSFEQLIQQNVVATQHLLEAATETGLEKIIYTSTGAVYGEPSAKVSLESDVCQPNTLYGLTKKMAEDLILHYHLTKGINYVILRFPNVYGEGNKKGVLNNFLKDIHLKGSITVAGDGNQSRNFLYVSDACNAIIKSINYSQSDIFNISTGAKTSINEIVGLLKQYYSFDIIHKAPDNFLKNLLLDTSKAESFLGFKAIIKDPSSYIQNFKETNAKQ